MSVTVSRPPDLEDVRISPGDGSRPRLYPIAKRVRTFFDGIAVADSTQVQLMLEDGRLPVYYFPVDDVRMDLLSPGTRIESSPTKGPATYLSVGTGNRVAADAAWRYEASLAGGPDLSRLVAFHWRRMDAWFEEDEEVIAHARDPFHRIDILRSSRHIQVGLNGTVLADTRASRMLFETGLPVRYYIPREDVVLDALARSDTQTACAYKGRTGQYWTMRDDTRDIAWTYESPLPEAGAITGMICFYNERTDITVEGLAQSRPQTPWS